MASADKKQTIKHLPNGPYLCSNLSVLVSYADGTHKTNGFTGDKDPDGVPDKRENFEGDKVVVQDNRGLCAHAGRCTLETVFRPGKEPFVDANGASADQIIETIKQCPSGALSHSIDGVEHAERGGDPQIGVAPNGPYICSGGVKLEDVELPEGATLDHVALCRCGASMNKHFCSGAHWDVRFDENAGD
ncbi:MAG: (4Fe-4S)-binding protein [Candidatus Latescibacterota bacterium]|nr:(4Fe-4S)-binding protein [Candidatus Latescibacterota bacterium]